MSFTNTRDLIGDQATLDGLVAHTLSELYEDGVDTIGSSAFQSNNGLRYVEMPGVVATFLGSCIFSNCVCLVSASFQNAKHIGQAMFYGCNALTTFYAPEVSMIGANAFAMCCALKNISFTNINGLGRSTFYDCYELQSVTLGTSITNIPEECFARCTMLSDINLQSARIISNSAFAYCTNLPALSLPAVSQIGSYAFYRAIVDHFILPSATAVYSHMTNTATEVDFYSGVNIGAYTFSENYNLDALILRSTALCTLQNTNALYNTPIASGSGYIYVPNALLSSYKVATNWAAYESQIVSLDAYPIDTVTGTITDSWSEIFAAEEDGTYTTKYNIGDTKVLTIGKFKIPMQIVAMNTDELADGSGNAKITWLSLNCAFNAQIHSTAPNTPGWDNSSLRLGLMQKLYNQMDNVVKSKVKSVKKTFFDYATLSTKTTTDDLWVPSYREIYGGPQTSYHVMEESGCIYSSCFTNNGERIKRSGATGIGPVCYWLLRTQFNNSAGLYYEVTGDGSVAQIQADYYNSVCFGFCT